MTVRDQELTAAAARVVAAPAPSGARAADNGERFADGMRADETRKRIVDFLQAWARAASKP